jgi:hypothetical protein
MLNLRIASILFSLIFILNARAANPRMYLAFPSDAYESSSSYFQVISDIAVPTATTVTYTVSGTATAGVDYYALSGSVTIPQGQSGALIWVTPIQDSLLEGNETVGVQLQPGATYDLGSPSGWNMTIRDDDQSTITVQATDATAAEPSDTGTYTFTRSGGNISAALTVNYTVSGTATSGSDYTALSGSVTFAANAATATVTLSPIDDSVYYEGNETAIVTISASANQMYLVGSPNSATVTIADNDRPRIYLSSNTDAYEPSTAGYFYVLSSQTLATPLTLTYTVSGAATPGVDYTALSGTVTIPAGANVAYIPVYPIDDALLEGTEDVIAQLNAGAGFDLGSPSGWWCYIHDNDQSTITVQATDATAAEPADTGTFTFTRTGGNISGALTVNYTVSGTATSGNDYTALSGSVSFAANATTATVTVTPINDSVYNEGNETVVVTISSSSSQLYLVGSPSSATVNIADDDKPTLSFVSSTHASEPSTPGSFNISSGVNLATALTFSYTVGGTATAGADYVTLSGTATIPAGGNLATIVVTPIDDLLKEGTETVTAQITPGSSYFIGNGPSTVNIYDNDVPMVTIQATDNTASEIGSDTGTFTVTRSGGGLNVGTTVNYTLSGSAINGVDYSTLSGSVTFAPNQTVATITVDAAEDADPEGTETVIATLTPGGFNYGVGTPSSATVNILNVTGWRLNTDIGTSYQQFLADHGEMPWDQAPTAFASDQANVLYIVARYYDGDMWYSQILKWTSADGWSVVPNTSGIFGVPYYMCKFGNKLYVAGGFSAVPADDGVSYKAADSLAVLDLTTHHWQATDEGLAITGNAITSMKVASWGGGMLGSRTYLYLTGMSYINGAPCNSIARGYDASGHWQWETMNGGISLGTGSETPFARSVEVNPTGTWDSTYGYRHIVYVGGSFERVGPSASVVATNLAIWTESTGTWSGMGSNGRGVTSYYDDCNDNCITKGHGGPVNALAWANGYLYIVGTPFSAINGLAYAHTTTEGPCFCNWYTPFSLAKYNGSTLGTWDAKSAYDWWTSYVEFRSVAAAGPNAFIAGDFGVSFVPAGTFPASPVQAAPAYRVNGSTWEMIDPNPVIGQPHSLKYERVIAANQNSAFFIIQDPNYSNGYSLRWYHN